MRELMAPEVELGVVTAVSSTRSRDRPRRSGATATRSRPAGEQRVLSAERELAHQIARDGGTETAAVQQARAAIERARTA
jgi:general stress protein YciG